MTRQVTVGVGDGLSGLLRVSGRSYLEIDQDGQPKRGVSAATSTPTRASGWRPMTRCAFASATPGRSGSWSTASTRAMGDSGAVVEWRITRR